MKTSCTSQLHARHCSIEGETSIAVKTLAPRPTRHRIGVMATIGVRAALMCAFISAAGPTARAQRPPPAIGELDHAAWTIRDGAPSSVYALAQSSDGMLWIGTTTGLYQFDGARFEPFEPPPGVVLPALSVSELLALPDGRLWIGYSRGGVSVLARGRVVSYGEREGVRNLVGAVHVRHVRRRLGRRRVVAARRHCRSRDDDTPKRKRPDLPSCFHGPLL